MALRPLVTAQASPTGAALVSAGLTLARCAACEPRVGGVVGPLNE